MEKAKRGRPLKPENNVELISKAKCQLCSEVFSYVHEFPEECPFCGSINIHQLEEYEYDLL